MEKLDKDDIEILLIIDERGLQQTSGNMNLKRHIELEKSGYLTSISPSRGAMDIVEWRLTEKGKDYLRGLTS